MKRIINLLLIGSIVSSVILTGCKKDEDENTSTGDTTATITVYDNSNATVSGQVVYTYDQSTWDAHGDEPLVADKKVATNSDGKAKIVLDDITNLFAFESQETLHFSVHYTVNGIETTKNTALTFTKGSSRSASLKMD